MKNFDAIFNAVFLGIYIYHVFYFLLQYRLLKRIELFYYSIFLLSVVGYFAGKDKPIFKWMRFYKFLNLFYLFTFLLLGILKVESKNLMGIVSIITMPLTFITLVLLWRLKTVYSKVILWGSTCMAFGALIAYACVLYEIYVRVKLPFNAFLPFQVGLLFDLFILAYGLSLKTAETDKKLIASLQENQHLVETERSRVARDLHDGLGGLLSGIKLTLNSITGTIVVPDKNTDIFYRATTQLDNAIKEMRRVAHSLMPEALLKFGLSEAIQDFCDSINESGMVKMRFTKIGADKTLEKPTELVLYRIVQELGNNAIKHASAKNIFIQLNTHEKGITITVEDDGKGFDTTLITKSDATGLQNVQSRIDYLKGCWEIQSASGNGTSINIEIPF